MQKHKEMYTCVAVANAAKFQLHLSYRMWQLRDRHWKWETGEATEAAAFCGKHDTQRAPCCMLRELLYKI